MLPQSVNAPLAEVLEVISDTKLKIKQEFGGDGGGRSRALKLWPHRIWRCTILSGRVNPITARPSPAVSGTFIPLLGAIRPPSRAVFTICHGHLRVTPATDVEPLETGALFSTPDTIVL